MYQPGSAQPSNALTHPSVPAQDDVSERPLLASTTILLGHVPHHDELCPAVPEFFLSSSTAVPWLQGQHPHASTLCLL